ncbi:ketopantoate reductase family protein [Salinibacillus xinjiangensis]|uniref:2-dehydropantoate 2-reductase n=1 Tax=Salinibacillus xinjiangensis TaxID=1229268 RepID=A0A6G1X739_9BACI|nr:ketopantoate reductase family protein [Salinibacillus xinjiangensis]MRG86821.1 2-dehydropantoate 2-reductase [Salinibacillus xinjiangensis]
MNIVVLGAGAVGGYFGGKISAAGHPVQFLVRKRRYEQLKNRGLKVESVHGDFSIEPNLIIDPSEAENPDLVILGLKNYHIEGAIPQLKQLVEKGAKILPLLNGIEHLDLLTEELGQENVLGGLCYIESTLNTEGDIIQTSSMHDVIFGPLTSVDQAFLQEVESIMKQAEFNVTLTDSILEEIWKKFVFITSFSGITSAVRAPIGVVIQDQVASEFLRDLITEVYEISKARKIALPEDTVESVMQKLQGASPKFTSSMHRDLQKGLPLELDSLHGYLLKLGKQHQIETPTLKAIYALLHPFKEGE